MKKKALFGLLIALAVCSCQIKEDGELTHEGKIFNATMEAIVDDATDADTKTSLDASGNVLWKQGDQVSIFAGSTINEHYQVTDASDGKTAAALNRIESPDAAAGGAISNNVAFYPYTATAEITKSGSGYLISGLSLPATQNYSESSFGNGAFPMTAVTSSASDYNLKFKNVLGGLKLQLKGTAAITSISVTGNNNEKLCGAAEVTVSGDNAPAITLTDASAKTVTLDCGNGVQLEANTTNAFIIALPPMTMSGGFTVTVTDSQNKQMEIKTTRSQTITRSNLLSMPAVTFVAPDPTSVPAHAVDLGLPSGLKWASCNLGASAPEEYGDFFQWGETKPHYYSLDPLTWKENKTGYEWTNYKFRTSGNTSNTVRISKYNTSSSCGPVDNNTVLDSEDDAAAVNWGGSWRMPTADEWDELINKCSWTWTTQNGVNGYLVTGSNHNSIFLPAAGLWSGSDIYYPGSLGRYWSLSLGTDFPAYAGGVSLSSGSVYTCTSDRSFGQSVRPVTVKEGVLVHVTGLELDNDSICLMEGERTTIKAIVTPVDASNPIVIWSSSNNKVASVNSQGRVTAISPGTAIITAKTKDGNCIATCTAIIKTPKEASGFAIDLGLPSGIWWASRNVGANAPEEYGDYFAWGETSPYYAVGYAQSYSPVWKLGKSTGYGWTSYKWTSYKFTDESDIYPLSKYVIKAEHSTVDNKDVLDPEDDAAQVKWGGKWRMPTIGEWQELRVCCKWRDTTLEGVEGELVTGPNGNSIFLPKAGYRVSKNICDDGSLGAYWSSSLYYYSYGAWSVGFRSDGSNAGDIWWTVNDRYCGYQIRPVLE
ncbi:MAG: Ig-like domain-containing protein [Bacteroidales bacterium]|nr:Ig-like domain-containing protein [Bacteroidales bacterium]